MDRISALRNVENALAAYEAGEIDRATLEERVIGTLRTYATEFGEDSLTAYRAVGGDADGTVVVAPSPESARRRVADLTDADADRVDLEPLGEANS